MSHTFVILALILAGCGSKPEPAKPAVHYQPITGAFGYALGQLIPSESDRVVFGERRFPPFTNIYLFCTTSGAVYSISGSAKFKDEGEYLSYKGSIISSLAEKYGLLREFRHVRIYGSNLKAVHLETLDENLHMVIDYRDEVVADAIQQQEEQQLKDRSKRDASKL